MRRILFAVIALQLAGCTTARQHTEDSTPCSCGNPRLDPILACYVNEAGTLIEDPNCR